jgi:hypothetical protein
MSKRNTIIACCLSVILTFTLFACSESSRAGRGIEEDYYKIRVSRRI